MQWQHPACHWKSLKHYAPVRSLLEIMRNAYPFMAPKLRYELEVDNLASNALTIMLTGSANMKTTWYITNFPQWILQVTDLQAHLLREKETLCTKRAIYCRAAQNFVAWQFAVVEYLTWHVRSHPRDVDLVCLKVNGPRTLVTAMWAISCSVHVI